MIVKGISNIKRKNANPGVQGPLGTIVFEINIDIPYII